MDDDIVTRLRNGTPTAVYVIANDAADEIERLRAEIERLRDAGDALHRALNDNIMWSALDQINAAWKEARRG